LLQHGLALIEDLAVGEADDGVAEFVEVRRAGLIVFDLLGVGIAIDLDAQFGFRDQSFCSAGVCGWRNSRACCSSIGGVRGWG